MIVQEFYDGQGLGNQLWGYAVLRSLASTQNLKFGVMHPEKFKGKEIFDIEFGENVFGGEGPDGGPPIKLPRGINKYIREKQQYEKKTGLDVSTVDYRILNISDDTKIDGNFQSLTYLKGVEDKIQVWLKVKSDRHSNMTLGNNVCVVHVRGGDYLNTYAYLKRKYYIAAMNNIRKINPDIKFIAITDDLNYCKYVLPEVTIIGSTPKGNNDEFRAKHHGGGRIVEDFELLNKARFMILSASTFSFWAAYLNKNHPYIIAPMYWFAHSKSNGWWSTSDCIVPGWKYQDRSGRLHSGEDCITEKLTATSAELMNIGNITRLKHRIETKILKLILRKI